jgi:hypothetical protein
MKASLRLVVSTSVLICCLIILSSCTGQASPSSSPSSPSEQPTTPETPEAPPSTPNAELVSRVEHMLSEHGVTITDAEGDWIWTGLPEDNSSPYPVPWADLLSVTFAVDDDYLYVRINVDGVYPSSITELPWYGEDQVNHLAVSICLDTDNNENTGCLADGGAEVVLDTGMMINPLGEWEPGYDFWYGPTGVDSPENQRYAHMGNMNLIVAVWGGPGFDYLVIVYPVGLLGLHPGQTITVDGWDECESLQYQEGHATVDTLGPDGTNPRIVIQLPN